MTMSQYTTQISHPLPSSSQPIVTMTCSLTSLCLDATFSVYSFLSYTDSLHLLCSNLYLKSHKDELEKYCQHKQPHGKV